MKAVAALLGLVCAVLVSYSEAAPNPQPNCCGLGGGCGNYFGGECCGGLSCGPALTCIAAEYPFPAYGPYGYPYYGYYGGYGYSGPACIGCGCGCDVCSGCDYGYGGIGLGGIGFGGLGGIY